MLTSILCKTVVGRDYPVIFSFIYKAVIITYLRELNIIFYLWIPRKLILKNYELELSLVSSKGIIIEALIIRLCKKLDTLQSTNSIIV